MDFAIPGIIGLLINLDAAASDVERRMTLIIEIGENGIRRSRIEIGTDTGDHTRKIGWAAGAVKPFRTLIVVIADDAAEAIKGINIRERCEGIGIEEMPTFVGNTA
jgi:hypothetical protein